MSKNKTVTLASVILVFILFIAMKPGDNPVLLMRVASIAAVAVFFGMILYTRVLWRISPFTALHNHIDIGGKWYGKLVRENGDECEIDANITQYLDDIKVKIKTDDFFNDSLACKMRRDAQGTYLYVAYKAKPTGKLGSKEQIEFGTFIIKCDEDFLDGIFYTSGGVYGKVELYRK
jgi:hypothetical protein